MIKKWVDDRTGTMCWCIEITPEGGHRMSSEAWEMFADGGMLIQHALRDETAPVRLASLGVMSHD